MMHVLSVHLERTVAATVFQERFVWIDRCLRRAFGEALRDTKSAVWFTERFPQPADSPEARELFRREVERPAAAASEHQLRVACFELSDGSARLIVRAHRALIGRSLLFRIVMHLACGDDLDLAHLKSAAAAADDAKRDISHFEELTPAANWTSSVEGHHCGVIDPILVRGTRDYLFPALTRIVTCFNQGPHCSVLVLMDGGGWRLLALDDDMSLCAGSVVAQRKARARESGVWPTDERIGTLMTLPGTDRGLLVAVALIEDFPVDNPLIREIAYEPFLLPPLPVTVLCVEYANGTLSVAVRFDRAALSRQCAESLQTCLVNVIVAMVSTPHRLLSDIPLLTEAQRQATAMLGRSPGEERLLASCRLERRVTEISRDDPTAIAVSDSHGTLTYGELERKTDRLASDLIARGVGRGDRVGLCLSRSSNMLAVALAVLKAGGVYVPIDPANPANRIELICEDAQLALYVFETGEPCSTAASGSISLAELLRRSAALPARPLADRGLSIDDPAYMIYTSGSTGRPKGVLVSHRNVQALLGAVHREFALASSDVWSLFHSFAFDFSVWEAWGALLTGARVHVVPYDVSRDPEAFIDLINEQRVTVLSQTPSAFGQLAAHERQKPIGPHLRLVVFGGDALDARSLLPWFDRHPETECRLINLFGITETTVHVTATEMRRIHALTGSRTVGRPIDGWGVYVLAPDQSVLPAGVDGEIYVSGSGVALGYHNRPELNQQRFLPDLLGHGRMYRSGDRGRLLPNGELLHLGRLDNQIKLRGFRIELDEIRNVLLRCRGIEAAAALFTQHDEKDTATARIDAYVVLNEGGLSEVWSQAMQLLPEYMLPASIARVSSMPLTANGKLNPKSLLERIVEKSSRPGQSAPLDEANVTHDNTVGSAEIERHLIELWTELFGRPVGPDDNFFDMGGNSLFAIRFASKLRQRGLPGLHPRDLYTQQTIARLTPVLARQGT
jgi:amino acid adenylation domain-containing protein